jgi:hypothetical protein
MDLRKASLHPMLFRTHFNNKMLSKALRALSTVKKFMQDSCDIMDEFKLMTDAELQIYFAQYQVCQDIYTTLENLLTFAIGDF